MTAIAPPFPAGFGEGLPWVSSVPYHPYMADEVVGLFDSGWGGLSVLAEVRALLPAEPLLYVADHACYPYGGRDPEEIRARSGLLAGELVGRGAKAVVVACNTASSLAIDEVRRVCLGVPVVGVVPAVKPAARASGSGTIVVLATPRTAEGSYLAELIRNHAPAVRVIVVPAPGLVELVEAGDVSGPRVESALDGLLGGPLAAGADQVVLGCTHYPFLRRAIERVVGPGVGVVDSGAAIARRLRGVLGERGFLAPRGGGGVRLTTTGDPAVVGPVATRLLGEPVVVAPLFAPVAGVPTGRVGRRREGPVDALDGRAEDAPTDLG